MDAEQGAAAATAFPAAFSRSAASITLSASRRRRSVMSENST
ncbi:MAG: hypothetical protein ACYCUG_15610 [Acidimicrobiales bacterium]